jgi:hypothetical protein
MTCPKPFCVTMSTGYNYHHTFLFWGTKNINFVILSVSSHFQCLLGTHTGPYVTTVHDQLVILTRFVLEDLLRRWGSRNPKRSRCFFKVLSRRAVKPGLPLCSIFLAFVYCVLSDVNLVFKYSTGKKMNNTHSESWLLIEKWFWPSLISPSIPANIGNMDLKISSKYFI